MPKKYYRTLASIITGALYGALVFSLLGGLYGGVFTWIIFGSLILMLSTSTISTTQGLFYSVALGLFGGLLLLLIAHLRGETDPTIILSGIFVWSVAGVSFGLIGWMQGLAIQNLLDKNKK